MNMPSPSRIILGAAVIIVGMLLLASNLDWFHVDLWLVVLDFWPLILILVGLRLVITNGLIYLGVAAMIIAGAVLALVFAPDSFRNRIMNQSTNAEVLPTQKLEERLRDNTERLIFKLDFGAATIRFHDLKDAGAYEAEFKNTNRIEEEVTSTGDELTISLDQAPFRGYFWQRIKNREADIALNPTIPLEVELDTGATKQELDFSNLKLERLKLDSGATSANVTFGANVDSLVADVDAGASSLTFRVPKGVGVRIESDSGLSSNNFEEAGLSKSENIYETADFPATAQKITLRLDAGATSIRLERY